MVIRRVNAAPLLATGTVIKSGQLKISREVNRILEQDHRLMQNMASGSTAQHVRLQFDVAGCNREQSELLSQLKGSPVFGNVTSLGPVEQE